MDKNKRVEYLVSKLPKDVNIEEKYKADFEKYARYLGNGTYSWKGIYAPDTRILWLTGVLKMEGIKFDEV